MDVSRVKHRCGKVEVLEVNRAEVRSFPRQDAVEKELEKFEGSCVGVNVAWVTDVIATNSDAGAIGIIFLWSNFTSHLCQTIALSQIKWVSYK